MTDALVVAGRAANCPGVLRMPLPRSPRGELASQHLNSSRDELGSEHSNSPRGES